MDDLHITVLRFQGAGLGAPLGLSGVGPMASIGGGPVGSEFLFHFFNLTLELFFATILLLLQYNQMNSFF